MKQMTATAVRFRRKTNKDAWEYGIMINEDKIIVDTDDALVPAPVYNYELMLDLGHIKFTFNFAK